MSKKELTLKDFDFCLSKENYDNTDLAVDVDLFLGISKVATKCGMKTIKSMHIIQLAAKIVSFAIEAEKSKGEDLTGEKK